MSYSPELFSEAAQLHRKLLEALGENHPSTQEALILAMEVAPPELLASLEARAREIGWIPENPDGFTESGEPLFSLETIAKLSGISVDKLQASADMVKASESRRKA